jgi:hypothetical protein
VSGLGELLASYPASRVDNSQPAGIGRVVALGKVAAWNNLGRNIVFADGGLRPRAVFDDTLYSEDDELSQYDLDVHAIVAVPGADLVLALNHLGVLRAFPVSEIPSQGAVRRLDPVWTRIFVEDVERAVIVGDRLVGSGPRCEGAMGLVVSEPLGRATGSKRIATRVELGTWGEVTALAAAPQQRDRAIAVGGVGRISLVALADGAAGRTRWDVEVGFRAAGLAWDGEVIWAAGSRLDEGIGDYDWEKVRGGEYVVLDATDGRVLAAAPLPDDIAWGNGGVPFVVVGGLPCGIARTGEVYVPAADSKTAWRRSPPVATSSLGIAHAAVVSHQLLYGFNRGGYQLCSIGERAIEQLARSQA